MSRLIEDGQTYQNWRGDYLKMEARAGYFIDQYGNQYTADGTQVGHTHRSAANINFDTAGTSEGWTPKQ